MVDAHDLVDINSVTALQHPLLQQQMLHLDDDVGFRNVDRCIPHLRQPDAVYQGIHPKRPQDARPLALRRGAVDVGDTEDSRVLPTEGGKALKKGGGRGEGGRLGETRRRRTWIDWLVG